MRDALLIVAHGSLDPDNIAEFWTLVEKVRAASGGLVEGAFLDYLEPSIPTGIDACLKRDARRIWVFPCFLFEGRHVQKDIPAILHQIAPRHPGIAIEILPCLGSDPELGALFASRVAEAEGRLSADASDCAVVFVAGGSKSPDANASLVREAKRYRESLGGRTLVAHAFLDLAEPNLESVLFECLQAGRRQIVVQPYFLFMGTLVKRIAAVADRVKTEKPELSCVIGRPLGPDDRLVEMILRRVSGKHSPTNEPEDV